MVEERKGQDRIVGDRPTTIPYSKLPNETPMISLIHICNSVTDEVLSRGHGMETTSPWTVSLRTPTVFPVLYVPERVAKPVSLPRGPLANDRVSYGVIRT